MPYAKRRNADGSFRVVNEDTGDVKMESGTEAEADKQLRLLRGIEHGWTPRRRKTLKRR
jgi:hypothetical protein